MSDFYILNDAHEPVPVADVLEWARWLEGEGDRRHVRNTSLAGNTVWVSTIFLGVDHNHGRFFGLGDARPILFETMIFGGVHNDDQWRYATWDEAVAGHDKAVELAKAGLS